MRILVADDSALVRAVLEEAVRALGHECVLAEDGDEAWRLFGRFAPDVVISDWLMPGLDGDELCRRIRDSPQGPYTYFILLTALDRANHVVHAMEAGADDYLRKPFDATELKARLITAARVTGLYAQLSAQQEKLEALNRRLFEDARRDALTQVGNRVALQEQLAQLSARAARSGHAFSLALFDVDRFKSLNDVSGHLEGDRALRQIAAALVDASRDTDAVFRYGGEEFVVVLPDEDLEGATRAAERLRERVASLALPHPGQGAGAIVTVSAGVAQLEPSDGDAFEPVLRRADAALYRAKDGGRNRVCVASPSVERLAA
jgi:diguanylate cyclase (GGDEF)-like protein